jgi:signal transduction histidine kinase
MTPTARQTGMAIALAAILVAFLAWQYHEFGHERQRARANLLGQSEVLRHALLGGVRAYRRLGRVFEDQMQALLDELVTTPGVVAAEVSDEQQGVLLRAGQTDELAPSKESPLWLPAGLQTSEATDLPVLPPGRGRGGGGGGGGGGPGWLRDDASQESDVRLRLTLLMDRSAMDGAIRSAAVMRLTVSLVGAAALAAATLAWLATVRAIQAHAQTRLLQAEAERLEELNVAASGLAHETRNPLNVIRGNLQRLLKKGDAERSDLSAVPLLIEECDRVTARINQFLTYARPQSARMTTVIVEPLIEELRTLLQGDLEAKQLTLRLQTEAPTIALRADPNLLRQVLFNLLQNAIAFSPAESAVVVHIRRRQADRVAIEVADQGPGVAPERVARLFTPYNSTRSDGAGLGLAIVKRLAAEQGWTVRYEDRPQGEDGPAGGASFVMEGIRVATDP